MKIGFNDIWDFLEYASKSKTNWHFSLKAGDFIIKNLKYKSLASLKNDKNFDTELISSLFIYREILWQPNVFVNAQKSLTPLKIFQAYCEEVFKNERLHPICKELIKGLIFHTKKAIIKLSENDNASTVNVLGEFRKKCFPIILFFIMHPRNREDYTNDAWNRLNYCVKIQITQFNNKFTELIYPYWEISFEKPPTRKVANNIEVHEPAAKPEE